MKRHAYLIISHNQWDLLRQLIMLIDDYRNDIYIHFDSKSKDAPIESVNTWVNKSRIIITDRISVFRGTFSLFEAELILLKSALKNGNYTYFHLLSGQDLPIKSQNYIHSFFAKNDGKNFIDVVCPELMRQGWHERVSLFHFLSRFILQKGLLSLTVRAFNKISIIIQKVFCINRLKKLEKNGFTLRYGSNWFSITEPFARYLIGKENFIKSVFEKYTFIPEELILQSIICSSEYKTTLYYTDNPEHSYNRANMRLIFWDGHTSPQIITMEHIDSLKNTPNIFARKFDYTNHRDIIEEVVSWVCAE